MKFQVIEKGNNPDFEEWWNNKGCEIVCGFICPKPNENGIEFSCKDVAKLAWDENKEKIIKLNDLIDRAMSILNNRIVWGDKNIDPTLFELVKLFSEKNS